MPEKAATKAPPASKPATASAKPSSAPASATAAARRPPASKAGAQAAASSASAAASTAAPAAAPASGASDAVVGSAPGYYINVGLFAEEANARRAQARLLNEGLPAFRQTLESAKGKRIRVRVGPYDGSKDANAAATRIRTLQLEAVVFKQ